MNIQTVQVGDTVKYSKPQAGEADFRFVLLTDPCEATVDIQLICEWRIKPIETVSRDEICAVDE